MFRDKLHIFPIFIVIYVPASFFITYGIAVGNGHVVPGFPYISDTGTKEPESCVFGQLLNIGAVIALVVFYIRYQQIATYQSDCPVRRITKCNKAALILGWIAAFGISLVGNFQETNVLVVHLIGAFLAFFIGWVYCCLQTYLSYKLPEIPGSSRNLRSARFIICVLTFIFMIVILVAGKFAMEENPRKSDKKIPIGLSPGEAGYPAYLTSTLSEWIIAFLICMYVATFTPEFKYFEMIKPKITFRQKCVLSGIAPSQQSKTNEVMTIENGGENFADRRSACDTGSLPPESCVFGQLLNIGAVIVSAVFYIRYKQVETYQRDCPVRSITNVNRVALALGLMAAFGISLVGNFQDENVVVVHLIGAFLAFVIGAFYCCLQTYLSFKLPDIPGSSRKLILARLIICVLDFSFMITILIASRLANEDKPKDLKPRCWTSDKPGYAAHLTSTISEWIIAFLTCLYVATFTPEFKHFELIKPKIIFREITRNGVVPELESNKEPKAVTMRADEASVKY
ncbi:uncharacterized protein LOC133191561 [Saccostrea echinata]|uniref:uncharacterized protein LOC133191561 n=1 Tax=Saccostrea echinata TaxID=191078 RepID=UPI002A825911|nr:uncharacterized protein LOC133191561 [Saccostrea echinata]